VLWCAMQQSTQSKPPSDFQSASMCATMHKQHYNRCTSPCRAAVAAVQQAYPQRSVVLYTGDGLTASQLADRAQQKFALDVRPKFQVTISCAARDAS
jgi:hypothetical protein